MSAGDSRRSLTSEHSGISYGSDDGEHRVNLRSLTARVEHVGGTGERFDTPLPALPLPGTHGERYDDCGSDVPRFCADCGHVEHVGRCCYRSGCPRCWKGWDRRRAVSIAAKLEALRKYRETSEGEGWAGWKLHHLALSPPDGFAVDSDEPVQHTIDGLKGILEELGAATGYIFYHPYRGSDGDDRGFWSDILPDGDPTSMDDLKEHIQHDPHFHAVVLSKHVAGGFSTKHIEEKTGWVIERITKGDDSDVSIYNDYDLARVVTYCLSHTGIGDRAAYRAYGEVANFTPTEEIETQIDAAVRSVAPNTLGLRYDSLMCAEPYTVGGYKVDPSGFYAGDASGGSDDEQGQLEDDDTTECRGRLVTINKAPAFLDDDEWSAKAPHADELADVWSEWAMRDKPPTD